MSFILSKILWVFFSPGNLLALLLLLGVFLSVAHSELRRRFGRQMCFFLALVLFIIGVLPVGEWMLLPLENRFTAVKPDHVDGIILVGGDENAEMTEARGTPAVMFSANDYMSFAGLVRQYPQAKLVFSGGPADIVPHTKTQPADVARQALASLGVPVDRMTFESHSRNTYENAMKSAAIVHPQPQQKWLLVADAFHMPRTVACFRKAGWNVFPMPTSYMTEGNYVPRFRFNLAGHLVQMDIAMHEYVGLVAYRLMGLTDALWPS